jgi:hypothetical protein
VWSFSRVPAQMCRGALLFNVCPRPQSS